MTSVVTDLRITALIVLFLSVSAVCQSPSGQASSKPKSDPCEATRRYAYNEGLKESTDAAAKEAWAKGFSAGLDLERTIYSITVGTAPQVQQISIIVEDIDGSTSYQFAAAEVIRTYFADFLNVASGSGLVLHIGGTKSMALSYGDVQSVAVDIVVRANQTLIVGADKRLIDGQLQLASEGGTLKGYSQQEKAQAVREYIYKALSEYKQKWEQAAPKPSQQGGGV